MSARPSVSRLKVVLVVSAVTALTIFLMLCVYFGTTSKNMNSLYWMQVMSGNWSASRSMGTKVAISGFGFGVAGVIAVVLNVGNFVAIWTLFIKIWRVSSSVGKIQERLMKGNEILPARDSSIKATILGLCTPEQKRVMHPILEEAFPQANKTWEKTMNELFGPEVVRSLNALLEKNLGAENSPAPG